MGNVCSIYRVDYLASYGPGLFYASVMLLVVLMLVATNLDEAITSGAFFRSIVYLVVFIISLFALRMVISGG